MSEEIDIPKVPLSRTEQYLTKIVKELSGSTEEVEIPKTTLSRVEMYLKAIIDLLAEAAVKKPITVKGTVDSVEELPEDAVTGDLYFVKNEKDESKTDEYIKTDTDWDQIGDTGVDLTNYVQKTDYVSNYKLGLVRTIPNFGISSGIGPNGTLSIYHPTDEEIADHNKVMINYTALTLDRIPQVVNYYVDGKSLEMDADTHTVQIHHPTTEEISAEGADLEHQALTLDRVEDVANYFGIQSKDYLAETYATKEELGKIKIKKITDVKHERPGNTNVHFLPDSDGIVINIQAEASNSDYEVIPHIKFSNQGTGMYATTYMFVKTSTGELISSGALLPDEIKEGMDVTVTTWYITGISFVSS